MSDIAIKVENLSKLYTLGNSKSGSIYDTFGNLFKRKNIEENSFWALNDLSFEIKYGQAVGIIGKNGAGKSTLLKVLSRITEPTKGRFTINGRVSSLLEVGTGFHAELSGRENIFLNGTILGMSRAEVRQKLDEIVEFSGVGKFLDTPVKHYSSGMYVRLAFAVAAHLEPEILIIDEVLAVGDAAFQKKCLGKMEQVTSEGRTVLFVSHNMHAIEQLCTSGICLNKGSLHLQSNNIREVITDYFNENKTGKNSTEWINLENELENEIHSLSHFGLYDKEGNSISESIRNDQQIYLRIYGNLKQIDPIWHLGFVIRNEDQQIIYWSKFTDIDEKLWPTFEIGPFTMEIALPTNLLNEGEYTIEIYSELRNKKSFIKPGRNSPNIIFTIRGGLSNSPYWLEKREGILAPILPWKIL